MISDRVTKAIAEPRTLTATAAVYGHNFHTAMSYVKHGVIRPDVKLKGESKKRLSAREQFLTLVVRNITAAGLRIKSAEYFCEVLRPFLGLLALQSVPEPGKARDFLEKSFADVSSDVFLIAEPATSEDEKLLMQQDPEMKAGEPIMISLKTVGQERFAKNIEGLSAFKFRITLIEIRSLLEEFLGRLWAYEEGKDYVPKKPGAETKAALKRMRETQEVR